MYDNARDTCNAILRPSCNHGEVIDIYVEMVWFSYHHGNSRHVCITIVPLLCGHDNLYIAILRSLYDHDDGIDIPALQNIDLRTIAVTLRINKIF